MFEKLSPRGVEPPNPTSWPYKGTTGPVEAPMHDGLPLAENVGITRRTVWIVQSEVTDLEAHPGAQIGDVEWQFSDGPPGDRSTSADYVDILQGLAAFSGCIMHFVPAEPDPVTPDYIVDGHMYPNEDSDQASDGTHPPFYVFDVEKQRNLPGRYHTRKDAQGIADFLNNDRVLARMKADAPTAARHYADLMNDMGPTTLPPIEVVPLAEVEKAYNLYGWLEAVQVHEPGMWENIEGGPTGWWAVANDYGIFAYFHDPADAYRFRLDYINRQLNP